jgi:hypothetical protein
MDKFRCYVRDVYHIATVIGITFATWKVVRHWRAGFAENTGHTIDSSVKAAAEKLEKTAITLEKWAAGGMGENLGKGVDEVLTDTKKTLDTATDLVQRALSHAK